MASLRSAVRESAGAVLRATDGIDWIAADRIADAIADRVVAQLGALSAVHLTREDRAVLLDAHRCMRCHCARHDEHHNAAAALLNRLAMGGSNG